MHGAMGGGGLLFALALGVGMGVFDRCEMPGALVFVVQRVIQTPLEGPLVMLVSVGHQVCHDTVTERRPQILRRPGTHPQRVRPVRGVGSLDTKAIPTRDGVMPGFGDHQRIGEA